MYYLNHICNGVSIKVVLSEYNMDMQAETAYILAFIYFGLAIILPVHILEFHQFSYDRIQAYKAFQQLGKYPYTHSCTSVISPSIKINLYWEN